MKEIINKKNYLDKNGQTAEKKKEKKTFFEAYFMEYNETLLLAAGPLSA